MPDNNTVETIELTEPEPVVKDVAPTRETLRESGWTKEEMDAAEKRGMVQTPEQKKKADDEAKAKADLEAKAKADAEAAEKAKLEQNRRADDKGGKNDLQHLSDTKLTPEQEKALKDALGENSSAFGLYLARKAERKARQAAEKQLEQERQSRLDLEARLKKLEQPKTRLVDEDGNEIDPDDLPLTPKRLKELQAKEAAERAKENEDRERAASALAQAHTDQEEYARQIYPDFDKTMELVPDLIKNLDKLVPEPAKRSKIRALQAQLRFAAHNADKIGLDEYHAALIAYEIGQMHPKYGSNAENTATEKNGDASESDGKSNDPKKGNGTLTPEQMKRMEENTQRRASSASVSGGGGKRTIAVEDVDLKVLNGMDAAHRMEFKTKYPDRYAKILRG